MSGHTRWVIQIRHEKVEIVHWYKYLRTIFEDTLKWDFNTEATTKKGNQRSICCGSSDLLTLMQQLFLSCFITLPERFDLFFHLLVL